MRTARLITGLATTSAVMAIVPATASAATFCVNRPGCSGTGAATIQDAIDAAATSPGRDSILIGGGTYAGEFVDRAGNPVDVEGAGSSTVLVNADGTGSNHPVVVIQDPSSVVRRVSVRVSPAAG
jgi:pectin methylesterase-like acyl-CoA thioesterase